MSKQIKNASSSGFKKEKAGHSSSNRQSSTRVSEAASSTRIISSNQPKVCNKSCNNLDLWGHQTSLPMNYDSNLLISAEFDSKHLVELDSKHLVELDSHSDKLDLKNLVEIDS